MGKDNELETTITTAVDSAICLNQYEVYIKAPHYFDEDGDRKWK